MWDRPFPVPPTLLTRSGLRWTLAPNHACSLGISFPNGLQREDHVTSLQTSNLPLHPPTLFPPPHRAGPLQKGPKPPKDPEQTLPQFPFLLI